MIEHTRKKVTSLRPFCGQRASGRQRCLVESFEARLLMHVAVQHPVADQSIAAGETATTIDLGAVIFNEELAPVVRLELVPSFGSIDIQLLKDAPQSVANFLNYVNTGAYDNTIIHRSEPGFVIQGGGYRPDGTDISPAGTPTVPNEFSPLRSNLRGTVAYAKAGGDPNSATSEFFINLADNSANLDVQNGGFTVFGTVVPRESNGMVTADVIADLPRVNATPVNGAFNHLPVRSIIDPTLTPVDPVTGLGPPQTPPRNKMVTLSRASVISQGGAMTYAATSSNLDLVSATVMSNNTLVLNYAAGQTGTSTITVTGTGDDGGIATDVFDVTVRPALTIGQGAAARSAQFTDADGTVSRVTVSGGSATLRLNGSGVTETPGRGVVVVGGTNLEWDGIVFGGSNPSVTVSSTGGDGRVVVNSMGAEGPVRSFNGRSVVLRGPAEFNNAIGRLSIGRSEGGTITINRSGHAGFVEPQITMDAAVDTDVTSQAPLKLRLGSWTGTAVVNESDEDSIIASALRSLVVDGDFTGNLLVGRFADPTISPVVGSVRIDGTLTGHWNTDSIHTLRAGSITNAAIRAESFIGSILTGSVTGSTIYAGFGNLPAGGMPSLADSMKPGAIRSLVVRGRSTTPQFVNSVIAASSLGRMSLGTVQENNPATVFGLSADSIASVGAITSGGQVIRAARLTDPSESIDQADFEVRVQ
jgi:cyclophilin family peptidyl-prolyl cis-trans isomerase